MSLSKKIFFYILTLYFANLEVVSSEDDIPSVIIIGAGVAGIAAAAKLFQDGFKSVTILEAENRIGGRIHTIKFKKYLVDLGAQFIYHENVGYSHLTRWPYEFMESEYHGCNKSIIYDSSGTRLNGRLARKYKKFIRAPEIKIPIFSDECYAAGESLERAVRKNLKSYPELEDEEGLRQMILMSDCATHGADMNQVPTKHCEIYNEPSEEVENWKNRGYSTILEVLMKKYPNPAEEFPTLNNTILNTEVSLIEYNLKNGKAIVKTTNGNTYCADHVIVTIPLGVLKEKYNTLFYPPLPEKKIKTIQRLGYGKQEKIFLFFDKPFWDYTRSAKRELGFSIYWKRKDSAELERDPERSWLLGLHEFRFVKYKPKLLMSRVSGKYSEDMNKLSDQQVYNHIVEVLQKFFGKDYKVIKPTAMIRSNWNTNKNFRGSWTYYKMREPGEDDVFCSDLAEPLGGDKLTVLFAGEAVHHCRFGSVGGAISSGFLTADWLTSLYPHLKKTYEGEASSNKITY